MVEQPTIGRVRRIGQSAPSQRDVNQCLLSMAPQEKAGGCNRLTARDVLVNHKGTKAQEAVLVASRVLPKIEASMDHRLFMQQVVEMANRNIALMDGTTGPIKRLIAEGDIVVGVWQDVAKEFGVGLLIIKGARLLQETVASGAALDCRVTAIPCDCYAQALAAKRVLGELDHDA
jgi:hypothetical protein